MNFNKIPKLKIYILYILLSHHSIYPMIWSAMRLNKSLPTNAWAKQLDQKNIIIKPAESQSPKATIEFSPEEQVSVFKKEESDSQKSATKPQNPTSIKPWYNLMQSNTTNATPKLYTPKDPQLTQLPDTYIKVLRERYPQAPVKLLQDYLGQTLTTLSQSPQWLKQAMTPQALKALDPSTFSIKFKQALEQYDTQSALPVEKSQALTLQKQEQKVSTQKASDSVQDLKTPKDAQEELVSENPKSGAQSEQDSVQDLITIKDSQKEQKSPVEKSSAKANQTSDTNPKKNFIPESMNFNEINKTQRILRNLFKDNKLPTTQEIKKAFEEIWTNISEKFNINITQPMKDMFFKKATESLPKDPIKSQRWINTMMQKIFDWIINSKKQKCAQDAEEFKNDIKQNIETMNQYDLLVYLLTKNIAYAEIAGDYIFMDTWKVSKDNLAKDFCESLIVDIMGNRKLSKQEINQVNTEFIKQFKQLTHKDLQIDNIFNQWDNYEFSPQENDKAYEQFNKIDTIKIDTKSSIQEIEKAYKKGVLIAHPDKGGTPKDFQDFTNAYNAIKASKTPQSLNFITLIAQTIDKLSQLKQEHIKLELPSKQNALKHKANTNAIKSNENIAHVIKQGIIQKNTNGTTTYLYDNQSITVNSDGKIVSMSNVKENPNKSMMSSDNQQGLSMIQLT